MIKDLKERMGELKKQKRLTQLFHRKCEKEDIEGLRKIIRDNSNISCIEVIPIISPRLNKPFEGCNEYFYTSDDENFNQKAREQILTI